VAFAGLKFGDAGSFDYGRNYGWLRRNSWTDVLPEFGGDTYGSDNFLQPVLTALQPTVTATSSVWLMA
jgi:outer membrane pore protein C